MNHPELRAVEEDISELLDHIPSSHGPTVEKPSKGDVDAASVTDTYVSSTLELEPLEAKGPKDHYDIVQSGEEEEISPWSKSYIGVPANYFSVGLMIGGSTSILYPILVVREGVTSSLLAASTSLVTIFWSYKIVFGFLSDCFPLFGWKRKPYIAAGWILCASFLFALASLGSGITTRHLVLMLTLANLGYVMADVAADGFMVWIAHREPMHKRGRMQTLIYATSSFGQIVVNLVILFGFSGPETNCPGYESDPNVPCTTDPTVMARSEFASEYPNEWCHVKCSNATFDFDLTIPHFALMIAAVNILSLPLYATLKEDKTPREEVGQFLAAFWTQVKRRAAWQVILYSMVSHITFGVVNAAKMPANYVWLDLHTAQYQIMMLLEKTIFFVGLNVVRKHALHVSWRKMIWYGSMTVTIFNSLYYIIVFDIWREAWFYIFTDVSAQFMYTLNFLASLFCMVEVAEPGWEALTYSLITTASNAVSPLSSVISYQLLAFFPSLNDQASIATDTDEVRREFALLHFLVILINLSSLLALPMLPRQKKETRDLVAGGETSAFWGRFALISAFVFLTYSTIVTFVTVAAHDMYGCLKIFGGGGCSADESSAPAHVLVAAVLVYCYGVNFYHSFWPCLRGKRRFSFSMFF